MTSFSGKKNLKPQAIYIVGSSDVEAVQFLFHFHASRRLPNIIKEVKHYRLKILRGESKNAIFKTAFQIQTKNIFSYNLEDNSLIFFWR